MSLGTEKISLKHAPMCSFIPKVI